MAEEVYPVISDLGEEGVVITRTMTMRNQQTPFDLENNPVELSNLASQKTSTVSALKQEVHKNQTRAEETSL